MRLRTLLVVLLAACTDPGSDARQPGPPVRAPAPVESVESVADADADPRASPSSADQDTSPASTPPGFAPDTDRWIAGFDRVGPLRIGMSFAKAEAALGGPLELTGIFGDECDYAEGDVVPEGIGLMVSRDTVVRIDVHYPGVATVAGIGVGDPESRVLEAYAGHVRTEPHPYDGPEWHYLVVQPVASEMRGMGMILETDGETVHSYRVGRMGQVRWIEGCA